MPISANALKVERVITTLSFAVIANIQKGYTEDEWNYETYKVAKTADSGTAYCASKTFAKRAVFDYIKKTKAPFSIATICPPMVYDPLEHIVTSTVKLNMSFADMNRLMNRPEKGSTLHAVLRIL